jgi:hypothetical protein
MKDVILSTKTDLTGSFLYYDRKESSTLSIEQLNEAVYSGEITVDGMVASFRKHLQGTFEKDSSKRI